jgi:hypothetical protein
MKTWDLGIVQISDSMEYKGVIEEVTTMILLKKLKSQSPKRKMNKVVVNTSKLFLISYNA